MNPKAYFFARACHMHQLSITLSNACKESETGTAETLATPLHVPRRVLRDDATREASCDRLARTLSVFRGGRGARASLAALDHSPRRSRP